MSTEIVVGAVGGGVNARMGEAHRHGAADLIFFPQRTGEEESSPRCASYFADGEWVPSFRWAAGIELPCLLALSLRAIKMTLIVLVLLLLLLLPLVCRISTTFTRRSALGRAVSVKCSRVGSG